MGRLKRILHWLLDRHHHDDGLAPDDWDYDR